MSWLDVNKQTPFMTGFLPWCISPFAATSWLFFTQAGQQCIAGVVLTKKSIVLWYIDVKFLSTAQWKAEQPGEGRGDAVPLY